MAWASSGSTNSELIDNMARNGILGEVIEGSGVNPETAIERISRAMKKVDRANYVRNKKDAYEDSPQYVIYLVLGYSC